MGASAYFKNLPLIKYNELAMVDISKRVNILNKVFADRYSFYPYVVKEGLRAEQVAEKYYGDQDYVWLVYLSNGIIDPYHDWHKDSRTFDLYIIDKYGSIETAMNTVVGYRVNWYQDDRRLSLAQYEQLQPYELKYWTPEFDVNNNPMYYVRKQFDLTISSRDANGNVVNDVPVLESQYWSLFSAYDVEEESNALKRHIRLLDNRLAQTALSNLKELVNA